MEFQLQSSKNGPIIKLRARLKSPGPWVGLRTASDSVLKPIRKNQSDMFWLFSQTIPNMIGKAVEGTSVLAEVTADGKGVLAFAGSSKTGMYIPASVLFLPNKVPSPPH